MAAPHQHKSPSPSEPTPGFSSDERQLLKGMRLLATAGDQSLLDDIEAILPMIQQVDDDAGLFKDPATQQLLAEYLHHRRLQMELSCALNSTASKIMGYPEGPLKDCLLGLFQTASAPLRRAADESESPEDTTRAEFFKHNEASISNNSLL